MHPRESTYRKQEVKARSLYGAPFLLLLEGRLNWVMRHAPVAGTGCCLGQLGALGGCGPVFFVGSRSAGLGRSLGNAAHAPMGDSLFEVNEDLRAWQKAGGGSIHAIGTRRP